MTYRELQEEHWEWASRNFGDERSPQAALQPALGVCEEYGELHVAMQDYLNEKPDARDEVEDAIGDMCIYLLDVCNRMNWEMPEPSNLHIDDSEERALGELAHSVLKSAQGIRKNEDHDQVGVDAIGTLLGFLDLHANIHECESALRCTEVAWQVVKLRDWTKERNNAV